MKKINLIKLVSKLVYALVLLLTVSVKAGAFGPGQGPKPKTPIDMYEGILVAVAVVMVVGAYLYKTNKKAIRA